MEDDERRSAEVEEVETPPENAKDGCFYTISTLMILFFLIPAVIGIVLFVLWLIFGD